MIIIINDKDNVAIALTDLPAGKEIKAGNDVIIVQESIPYGHKVALKDISKGEEIIKYGEVIGAAVENIKKGSHVHTHNMAGLRGRGDEKH
ncbi:MAG: UxaA family hydrolase [Thermoanaerobacteraceae bacterium]|nr:UxaA family hydrolase [Thermoanaerobacteraceae bacterium]